MIGQNCHQADQLDFCGQPTCGSLSPAPFELLANMNLSVVKMRTDASDAVDVVQHAV